MSESHVPTDPPSRPRVAYQGAPGAYGDAAVARHWGGAAEAMSRPTFAAVLESVAAGETAYGVLPVWNTSVGEIVDAREALDAAGDRVERVADVMVPVRHALLAAPGATIESIRAVGSHPAALAQCTRFLAAHPRLHAVEAWDTAGAAAELAALSRGDAASATAWFAAVPDARPATLAAIASPRVAAALGLAVLREDIQDDADNATRFAVVRARPRLRALRGATTVATDDRAAVDEALRELLDTLVAENAIAPAEVVSAIFTATPDLHALAPGPVVDASGWRDVPVLTLREMDVRGAPGLCVRVLLHLWLPAGRRLRPAYLRGAVVLRPDLARGDTVSS